jgi:ATP phosphoribosyltransferase
VPTYVQYGGADLGVAGKDVLLEPRRACTSRWT